MSSIARARWMGLVGCLWVLAACGGDGSADGDGDRDAGSSRDAASSADGGTSDFDGSSTDPDGSSSTDDAGGSAGDADVDPDGGGGGDDGSITDLDATTPTDDASAMDAGGSTDDDASTSMDGGGSTDDDASSAMDAGAGADGGGSTDDDAASAMDAGSGDDASTTADTGIDPACPEPTCGAGCCPMGLVCGPTTIACVPTCASGIFCGPTDECCGLGTICQASGSCGSECSPGVFVCGTVCCGPGTTCDRSSDTCVDVDAGPMDAGSPDAGPPDAGNADAGSDAGVMRCMIAPSPSPFDDPVLEHHWRDPTLFAAWDQVIVSPVVIDLLPNAGTTDAVPEIVFVSYRNFDQAGVLRVIDGRAPYALRWTAAGAGGPDNAMATPIVRFDGHPAAGDIDGDGDIEILAGRHAGGVVAFDHLGNLLWERALPAGETTPNGSIALADLEGDGVVEAVIGRVVLDARTGVPRWTGTGGQGKNSQGPLSCVADVDEDGVMEVIAGRTVYRASGTVLWEVTGSGDGFCGVADLVDTTGARVRDGRPEIVRVASGRVRVHDAITGVERFNWALTGGGSGGAPTIADFDGDGRMEVGVAGATRYVVFDPDCAGTPLPAGCAAASIRWQVVTEDDSSNVTSSTVFDFNGDGTAEVVYNDEQYFRVYDGPTGTVLFEEPNPSRTRTEQPVVADVDADGNAEIVFSANNEAAFAGDHIAAAERIEGLEIWSSGDDSWVPARTVWNQHTYHIDNVTTSGGIPLHEPYSWEGHNTYRLNGSDTDVRLAPDLTVEAAPADLSMCAMDILRVCARITNRGDALVGPGVGVIFYDGDPRTGGPPVAMGATTMTLVPGATEVVCAPWSPPPVMVPHNVFASVDPGMGVTECIEDNNTVLVAMTACPGPS